MSDLNSELNLAAVDAADDSLSGDQLLGEGYELSDLPADEFEPPSDDGLDESKNFPDHFPEHFLNRMRVILWAQHQSLIAWILLVSLILMTGFFAYSWFINDGLVDIDRADSIQAEFRVDINSATLGEIVVLPGVGEKLAQAIVDYRDASGGFASLDELCHVPGIGDKTLKSLHPFLLPLKSPVE